MISMRKLLLLVLLCTMPPHGTAAGELHTPEAHAQRGDALVALGQRSRAVAEWRLALALAKRRGATQQQSDWLAAALQRKLAEPDG
jgi:hypothetical protein